MSRKGSAGQSGLVLLAKRPGLTSFSSLYAVKHALHTNKVGHTGTLDSFACGLLVVCTGSLTRLASRITALDKSYVAHIVFGSETDTLDPNGMVIRNAPLPVKEDFLRSLTRFTGEIQQRPPAFSALHVDGRRASDLVRAGKNVELPARPVTVFNSTVVSLTQDDDGRIVAAQVAFDVSKGTYIRSLARDIAADCGSAAHLIGLKRTRIGCFRLEDAAGYDLMDGEPDDTYEQKLREEILSHIQPMTPVFAQTCGLVPAVLKRGVERDFYTGRPLRNGLFESSPVMVDDGGENRPLAVFTADGVFAGVAEAAGGKLRYGFVVPPESEIER